MSRFIIAGAAAALLAASPMVLDSAVPAAFAQTSPSAWDKVEGNWITAKGNVKEQWGKLTDDDILQIKGKREQLVGKLQSRYGIDLPEADKQVSDFEKKYTR